MQTRPSTTVQVQLAGRREFGRFGRVAPRGHHLPCWTMTTALDRIASEKARACASPGSDQPRSAGAACSHSAPGKLSSALAESKRTTKQCDGENDMTNRHR